MSLIRISFSGPTGVSFEIQDENAVSALASMSILLAGPSAAVTPAKQDAARAKAATKASNAKVLEKVADAISGTPTETAKTDAPTVDYPTLQKEVFALVKAVTEKGLDPKEHVIGIAKSFGYDSFAKMKDAGPVGAMQFAAALAAVQAKAVEIAAIVVEEAVA